MARSTEHQDAVARRLAQLSAELDHTRVRPRADRPPAAAPRPQPPPPAAPPAPPPPPPAAPVVPVPGRHAARRPGALAAAVPATLRGRVALGPAQLTVVALVVAMGLAAACWWLLRSSPQRVDAPPVVPAPVALTSAAPLDDASPVAADAAASPEAGSVTVDVTGKVRRPGIVVLDAGARVVDAVTAAGGARPGVDLSALNLARLLVDGEQVVVGVPPPPGIAASAAAAPGATAGPLVNLNTATAEQLEALPEVGPVTAQSILAWRDEHGAFTSVDELLEVDGIGDVTLSRLADYVTV